MAAETYYYQWTGTLGLNEIKRVVDPAAIVVQTTFPIVAAITVETNAKPTLDNLMENAGFIEVTGPINPVIGDATGATTYNGGTIMGEYKRLVAADFPYDVLPTDSNLRVVGPLSGDVVINLAAATGSGHVYSFRDASTGGFDIRVTPASGDIESSSHVVAPNAALGVGGFLPIIDGAPTHWECTT
jgi:hypothetical protein